MNITPAFLKQLWLTLGASLAFLIIGLVRGYSSSAIPSLETIDPELIQTSEQKSWIGAIPPLGAFTGSLISWPLMKRAGRRRTLLLASPIWASMWLVLGFAKSYPMILAGRIGTGVCVGLVLAPVQVYVSECCDPETRGRLGSLPTLSMSLGILFSYIAGNWLYWRHLAFFSASFCGLLFLALLPLPESPVWLKSSGANEAANAAVLWLHLCPRAIAIVKEDQLETSKEEKSPRLFSRRVLCSSVVIRPLVLCLLLLLFQQLSGIDSIVFFTVEIFKTAGSTLDAMTATIIIGVVQLCSNTLSTMLVDHAGRRPLLLTSAAIMCASMVALGSAFYYEFEQESWLGYLPIASLIVFMAGFSLGFGGLPFLMLGELFPARQRSQLSAVASATNLLAMFVVIKTYHIMETILTSAGTFWMYGFFCALAFIFVLLAVPETKGKSLAEIEQIFIGNTNMKVHIEIPTISEIGGVDNHAYGSKVDNSKTVDNSLPRRRRTRHTDKIDWHSLQNI